MTKPTAIILAAGMGTRMGEIGRQNTKGMIRFKKKPVLEHILDSLENIVDESVIVVGNRKEQITSYFENQYKGIRIRYAEQEKPIGTTNAVKMAMQEVCGDSLILFCDILFKPEDLRLCASVYDSVLYMDLKDPTNCGLIGMDPADKIHFIHEKPPREEWEDFKNPNCTYPSYVGCANMSEDFRKQVVKGDFDHLESIPDAIGKYAIENPLQGIKIASRLSLGTEAEMIEAYRGFSVNYNTWVRLDWIHDEKVWKTHCFLPIPGNEEFYQAGHREMHSYEKYVLRDSFNLEHREDIMQSIDKIPPWILDNMAENVR